MSQLCACGFEEKQNYRTDSPTCSREGLRCAFSLITSKKWPISFIDVDVKTAFLQGKNLEINTFVHPPKEAQTNKIWKLKKCVYGLADASQYWYLKVREELCKLGARSSQLDQGLITFRNQTKIVGIVILFVDDIIWAGKPHFTNIINKFKNIFHIGTESTQTLIYVGIIIKQNKDISITIDHPNYRQYKHHGFI